MNELTKNDVIDITDEKLTDIVRGWNTIMIPYLKMYSTEDTEEILNRYLDCQYYYLGGDDVPELKRVLLLMAEQWKHYNGYELNDVLSCWYADEWDVICVLYRFENRDNEWYHYDTKSNSWY